LGRTTLRREQCDVLPESRDMGGPHCSLDNAIAKLGYSTTHKQTLTTLHGD
jgi:hypothetical protein